jgi:hypothetical protein
LAASTNHLMADEDNTGAADQNLDTGVDQGTNDTGADQGADSGAQDGKPSPYESQKRRAEIAETNAGTYKQQLIEAGLLNKDGTPKEQKPAPKQEASVSTTNDDVVRARLETRGVLDEDEQNEVMEAANLLKITPLQALTRPLVKARLEEMRADKKTKDATPAPTKGAGSHRNPGKLPDFSKMSNTEFDEWEKKNR